MLTNTEAFSGFSVDDLEAASSTGCRIAWFNDPAGNILSVLQER